MTIKSVCVFCGASDNIEQHYKDFAADCGRMIASKKLNLIFGGGDSGLMGAVSRAAHENGAKVTGVFPTLLSKFEPLSHNLDNTILVDSMSQRRDIMIQKAEAFITLPGGFGTLDEFFEVLTLKVLKQHNKPNIIINYNGFWDPCLETCERIIKLQFARSNAHEAYSVVNTIEEALAILQQFGIAN